MAQSVLSKSDQMLLLTQEMSKETERGEALLAVAYLEDLLGELIATAMVIQPEEVKKLQIFRGPVAPLGTFSARSRVAYSFGLLSKDEYDDIDLIRDIRNKFAHQMTGLSFELSEIAEICRKLKGAQIDGRPQSPRECFRKSAIRLMVEFIVRIQVASK